LRWEQVQQYPAYKSSATILSGQIWFIRFRDEERKENFVKDVLIKKLRFFLKTIATTREKEKDGTGRYSYIPGSLPG
jgi:hypothetical protein